MSTLLLAGVLFGLPAAAVAMTGRTSGSLTALHPAYLDALAANPSANLDQCANGSGTPQGTTCEWVNGNLGASKALYYEGDSVAYRMRFDHLTLSSHTVTIEWDTTKSGKHALDYLTSFDRTITSADPCEGVSGCGSPSTFAIPPDPQVTGAGVTPVAGNFTLYGGTITAVSAYSYPDGTGFSGDKSARLTITFTAADANPVLAWGGHIASHLDWDGIAAASIPGSPYHTALIGLDDSGGRQDRSLSSEAVIFPGSITIVKDATPNGSASFPFTASPSPLAAFSLVDDGTSANTKAFANITSFQTYTVGETVPSGWSLDSIGCVVTSANGGSYAVTKPSVAITLAEGENWTCTFNDSQPVQNGTLVVKKLVVNDDGGTASAGDWSIHVKSGSSDVSGSPQAGNGTTGTSYSLAPGSYFMTESGGPTGYVGPTFGGDCDSSGNITVVAGQTKTCTLTNDDQPAHLTVIKHVVDDNGGTAVAGDFTLAVTGTNVSSSSFPGAEDPGTTVTLDAGSYSVDETAGPDGYSKALGSGCSGTLAPGGSATCTITNDDQAPMLHLRKVVVNDDGGTAVAGDWTLTATGALGESATNLSGQSPVDSSAGFKADTYTLGEQGPAGYAGAWSCLEGGEVPVAITGGAITLALGEDVTCTATNDDVAAPPTPVTPAAPAPATLTVVKRVVNDNGGTAKPSDFTMHVTGDNPSQSSFPGNAAGTTITLGAGSYSVSETGPGGYRTTLSPGCSGTLAAGQSATCTLLNEDIPAPVVPAPIVDLSLTKVDTPDPVVVGGLVTYTLTVTNKVLSGGAFSAGNVTLADPLPAGVEFVKASSSRGTCTIDAAGLSCNLGTLAAGDTVTITLTARAATVGTVTNTAVVMSTETDANPADNTASAVTTVNGPFKPPAICAKVQVKPMSVKVGKRTVVVIVVRDQSGKPLAKASVHMRGPGVDVRGKTAKNGVYKRALTPKRPGIVVVRVPGPAACVGRLGVVGVFQPPVTG